ncbi:peptidoglycan DD-metalloendopeptidase family protein [Kitasatospora sp. NPDC057223]|uniref:M23 family metallopeptidase n=1 Tax=Kitasatospora sp. NPDC057223 TaxID=3346055 RepID=UPI00362A0C39
MSAITNRLPRLARIGIATGVTGAVLALPLVTAVSAQAHTVPAAKSHSAAVTGATSVDAIAVTQKTAAVEAAPAAPAAAPAAAAVESYKVHGGDTLSKIAASQNVTGGWHALYDNNREVIGSNPNLIFPGQKLALGAKAAAPAAEAPKPAAPKTSSDSAPAKKAAPSAKASVAPKAAETAKPAAPATKAPAAAATTAAAAPKPAAVASTSGYTAPIAGVKLGTAYGVAGSMWSSGHHTGADFVAATGTPLKAIANGTVVKAGNGGAYGNEVEIKLADGKYAQYAHLSSIGVKVGQTVTVGQQIGLSGATGNVTGPHLHFEVRTGSEYGSDIDPIAYLRAHGVSI